MEPCGARNRSDGYFTDGCVAARIADDRLDRPEAPGPSGVSRLAGARSPFHGAGRLSPGLLSGYPPAGLSAAAVKGQHSRACVGSRLYSPGGAIAEAPADGG